MAGKKFKKALEGYDPLKKYTVEEACALLPQDQDLVQVGRDGRRRRFASASTRSTPTRWSAARS